MDLGLEGKTGIVGGASRGLGRAVALALAREGMRLVVFSRSRDAIERAAAEVRDATGADVRAVTANASRAEDLQRVVDATVDAFGGVDVLVANQGGPAYGEALSTTDDAWQHAWDLAAMSVIRQCRLVVPVMRERGGGRIITITSTGVLEYIKGIAASSAARLAVTGFTNHLAREVAKDGILVNNVIPGWIRTERVQDLAEGEARATGSHVDEVLAEQARDIPLGRFGDPEDVADLVAFLASARAKYVTGANFQVDGGWARSTLA